LIATLHFDELGGVPFFAEPNIFAHAIDLLGLLEEVSVIKFALFFNDAETRLNILISSSAAVWQKYMWLQNAAGTYTKT